MARLTWQDVQAPELDIRGMAVAGATIGNAFDRLSQTLQDRYASQRAEATSAEIAKQLAITDPEAFNQAIDPTTLNSKADLAQVVQARNARALELTQTQAAREDLLNKQAATALGPELYGMLQAAYAGDVAAGQALQARGLEDPLIRRALGLYGGDMFQAFKEGQEFRESQRQAKEDERIAQGNLDVNRGQLGISSRRMALDEAQVGQNERGAQVGIQAARDLRTMDPKDALSAFYNSEAYLGLKTNAERLAAEANFTKQQPVLATPTGEAQARSADVISKNSAFSSYATAAADREAGALDTPEVRAARRAVELDGKVKADEAVAEINANSLFPLQTSLKPKIDTVLDTLKKDGIDVGYADVQAINDTYGADGNPIGFTDRLEARLRALAGARRDLSSIEAEQAGLRGPYLRAMAELDRLQNEIIRLENSPKALDRQRALEKREERDAAEKRFLEQFRTKK